MYSIVTIKKKLETRNNNNRFSGDFDTALAILSGAAARLVPR